MKKKHKLILLAFFLIIVCYPSWYSINYYAAGLVNHADLIEYGMTDDIEYCQKWRPDLPDLSKIDSPRVLQWAYKNNRLNSGTDISGVTLPILENSQTLHPQVLAISANILIAVGKEKAVDYLLKQSQKLRSGDVYGDINDIKISWLCRLIFESVNDQPLRAPNFGGLDLPYKSMPLSSWPKYPLAVSDGCIFVLGANYTGSGQPELAEFYVDYCSKNGQIRKEPYKVPDKTEYQPALEALFKSERWQAIEWRHEEKNFKYFYDEAWVKSLIKTQIE